MKAIAIFLVLLIVFSGCTTITEEAVEDKNTIVEEPLEEAQEKAKPLVLPQKEETREKADQQTQTINPQARPNVFLEKNGIEFEHYWPNSFFLKSDESEILVYNEGKQAMQFTATNMDFFVNGKAAPHYSGTWEKFPSRTSWEKIEYINIGQKYYKGEKLILEPGQKGKIHYHYTFDGDISQKEQEVEIDITFTANGAEEKIDLRLKRKTGETATQQYEQHDTNATGNTSNGGNYGH